MKSVKDKYLLMAADFAGYPLKEAIKEYLEKKEWKITGLRGDRPRENFIFAAVLPQF